jgi:hypothetical protein
LVRGGSGWVDDGGGVMLMMVVVVVMMMKMIVLPFKRTPSSQYRSWQLPY